MIAPFCIAPLLFTGMVPKGRGSLVASLAAQQLQIILGALLTHNSHTAKVTLSKHTIVRLWVYQF